MLSRSFSICKFSFKSELPKHWLYGNSTANATADEIFSRFESKFLPTSSASLSSIMLNSLVSVLSLLDHVSEDEDNKVEKMSLLVVQNDEGEEDD